MGTVEVYVDLLFLINAGMDGLCLGLTARLLHRRLRGWRLLLGAALGGAYAVLALFLCVGTVVSLFLDVAACVLLCAPVFGGRGSGGGRRFLGATAVYVVISMVMGGVMTALYNLLNRLGVAAWLPAGEDGLTAWLFALLAVVSGVVSLRGGRLFRRSVSVTTCTVTVTVEEQVVVLRGMVDTGNRLCDPIGGRAVICVDVAALTSVLPSSVADAIRRGEPEAALLGAGTLAHRLSLLPTATATGASLLVGLRPDRVTVTHEGRRRSEKAHEVDAVLALAGTLTDTEALVPAELVT